MGKEEEVKLVDFVHLDLEATGLSADNDRIVQIAVSLEQFTVDACSGCGDDGHVSFSREVTAEFSTYVHAEKPMSFAASKVTGIWDRDLQEAPDLRQSFQRLFDFLHANKREGATAHLIAQNGMGYDFRMLAREMDRCELSFEDECRKHNIVSLCDPLVWARDNLDSTKMMRKKDGSCDFTLGSIYLSLFGEEFENAHDATADTRAMMRICGSPQYASFVQSMLSLGAVEEQRSSEPQFPGEGRAVTNKPFYCSPSRFVSKLKDIAGEGATLADSANKRPRDCTSNKRHQNNKNKKKAKFFSAFKRFNQQSSSTVV